MTCGLVLCLTVHSFAQVGFQFFQPVQPPRNIQVMVHRGMWMAAPENSAVAIAMCHEDFCEWVEVDVRLTRDRQHVLIHNATVDATTNGTGLVNELTLAELQKLDAGSWFADRFAGTQILSLPEALNLAKGKVNLYLDCKAVDLEILVKDILAAEMESQVVVYVGLEDISVVRTLSGGRVAGMTKYRPESMSFESFVERIAPAVAEIDADRVTSELCRKFHSKGIKVQAKTVGGQRDTADTWGAVIDAGVDWLQTDDPAGLLFFNARRQLGEFPVKIAAHRGANRYAPENTLPAISLAERLGMDYAEIDIRTSRDGKQVLLHDSDLDRTTNGQGMVRDLMYAELQEYSTGDWFCKELEPLRVPSLSDGLEAFGESMRGYLDAKDITPELLVAVIHEHHLAERHVVYQSTDYCKALHEIDPQIRTLPPLRQFSDLDVVAASQPFGVDARWSILSAEMIAACHSKGIQVFSDALGLYENVEQYQTAISWGIDCIQTDHPLRVLRAIELLAEKQVD
ncbi:MAG: glycerophosphodiester phosphodiesterase family protein [Planctomycetales bacterium]|nr:glycerophosphodiester phosphodiesterase family protein [Planctomycetales bacterium]